MPFEPGKPKQDPAMDEIKEAADLVDEILGAPAPGKEGPPVGKTPGNLSESLGMGKTGETSPKTDDAAVTEEGSSQDMGPLVKMFGSEEDAKKAFAVGQKLPQLKGKSPSDMAATIKSDFQLRTRIMQDMAEGDDMMAQEEENKKMTPGPTAKDLMPGAARPPLMPPM